VLFFKGDLMMGEYRDIYVKKCFDGEVVAASGDATSVIYDLGSLSTTGYFSLQVALTGDGTATIEYELSNDNVNFMVPTGSSEIITGLVKTTGPGSDGQNIYDFGPILSRFMRIKLSETGTSDSITLTAFLAIS
jgi:hypothetical protein